MDTFARDNNAVHYADAARTRLQLHVFLCVCYTELQNEQQLYSRVPDRTTVCFIRVYFIHIEQIA